jgi:hypothetical protein
MPEDAPTAPNAADGTARASVLIIAWVGAFFALTCLPGVHWHDTGEFAATTWWWSLSHPPSHPLHALWARPFQWLPLGDLAFRANLASGLTLALALGLLRPLLRRWAPRLPAAVVTLLCAAPAVWPAVWLQGARAEVYALMVLLLVGVMRCVEPLNRTRDARWFLGAGFMIGLAGACHSLLGLAVVPLTLGVALRARLPLRAWVMAGGAGVAGLLTYAYLPLRAHAGLDVGWGNPTDLPRFIDTLLARDWQKNLVSGGTTGLDLGANAVAFTEYGLDQLGVAGALALGLAVCVGLPGAVRGGVGPLLGGVGLLVPILATRFFYPFDAENPDIGGYLAPALITALGLAAYTLSHGPRLLWPVLAIAPFARFDWDPGERSGSRAAESSIRRTFEEVAPGGVLVLAEYGSWFQAWWMRAVMAERPDVLVVYRGRLGQAWVAERAARVNPFGAAGADAARLGDFPDAYDPADTWFEVGVERRRLGALAERLSPAGISWRAAPAVTAAEVERAWRARLPVEGPIDRDTALSWAFQHALAADALLTSGHAAAGRIRFHIDAARSLLPGGEDALLDALEARLREAASGAPQGL